MFETGCKSVLYQEPENVLIVSIFKQKQVSIYDSHEKVATCNY
jgi:hypothetical protein